MDSTNPHLELITYFVYTYSQSNPPHMYTGNPVCEEHSYRHWHRAVLDKHLETRREITGALLILSLCPAGERRRYIVMTYLIGWAQAL